MRTQFTLKGTLLESVPLGTVTCTLPVVAPVGTVVVIKYCETTVNTAAVPLNVALVAPVRLLPRVLTAPPPRQRLAVFPQTAADWGCDPRPRASQLTVKV